MYRKFRLKLEIWIQFMTHDFHNQQQWNSNKRVYTCKSQHYFQCFNELYKSFQFRLWRELLQSITKYVRCLLLNLQFRNRIKLILVHYKVKCLNLHQKFFLFLKICFREFLHLELLKCRNLNWAQQNVFLKE